MISKKIISRFLCMAFIVTSMFTSIAPVQAFVNAGSSNQLDNAAAPVTSHPRLWLTTADLPRLRSWAVSTNPMYQNGLYTALSSAVPHANAHWSWSFNGGTGLPDAGWSDDGGINWVGDATEGYAEFFAFNSLVDPDPAKRDLYAKMSRDMLMYIMNQAVLGHANAPFRHSVFAINNRSNSWGEAFGLTVDWIYPYLTAQDKATIRAVFLMWSDDLVNASTTGGEHPQPVGVINDPQLLADKEQLRWATNNYYIGHMRSLALMSLSMDAADDPLVDPGKPATQLGNTLRSYIPNVTGAWLYQQYAIYEDPNVVAAAYGVSPDGLGIARGGLSVEGFTYGNSLGNVVETLLALHTAGYNDTALSGPQINLVNSSYWDQNIDALLNSVTPTSQVYGDGHEYLGHLYQMMNFGDLLRLWIEPSGLPLYASLGVYDQLTGNNARLQKSKWIVTNLLQGGPEKLYDRAGSNIWGNTYASDSILYFMLFEPGTPVAPDPRPATPTTFFSPSINRLLARTDWTPNASWFGYMCSWATINHQYGNCNQFEFYRKGEWLTKERSGYSHDGISLAPDYHNILGIKNSVSSGTGLPPANLLWFEDASWDRGAQWTNGGGAGDPTVLVSWNNSYAYGYGDATNLYNRPNQWLDTQDAVDVLHASRSIIWLKPDHIIIYDRATTKTPNFKRFNLTLLANPVIAGNTATVTTAGGQKFYIQSLLPANATITAAAVENFQSAADLEPTSHRLMIEDTSNPTDVRFLTILQGADAGTPKDAAAVIQSSAGNQFSGTVVANTAVLFPVSTTLPFITTTYSVPSTVTGHIITGLTPNGNYAVTIQIVGPNAQVTVAPGNGYKADSGGVLGIGAYDTAPAVQSISRAGVSPTKSASVDFKVTFSESVTGVDVGDFTLTTSGVSGAAVSGLSGTGSIYTVTVSTGTGDGTIRLDVNDNDSIIDVTNNPLAGIGTGNGNFTTGETYTINKTVPTFADVPATYWAYSFIERLYKAGVTGGCGVNPLIYCPDNSVTRAQMAVFLLKGIHGQGFTPPAVNGVTSFGDVAVDHWAAAWIKQLAAEGITSGCGNGNYCPEATVTRAQMAVFLLKAKHGSSYTPSNATGVFSDVPLGYWADKWIEQLAVEGVTSGCGNGNYCPDADVTRAQMAVFLVKAFSLP